MNSPRTRRLAVTSLLAVALTGCTDPYQREAPQTRSRTATPAPGDAERPGPAAAALPAVRHATEPGAREAAAKFASAWMNWDWRTLAEHQRTLARLAAGRLAVALRANARAGAADASLARDRPSSRGSVVALATRDQPGRVSAIVVTREQTYTGGHADLGGRHHRIYHALLSRGAHGWQVTAWTPLP